MLRIGRGVRGSRFRLSLSLFPNFASLFISPDSPGMKRKRKDEELFFPISSSSKVSCVFSKSCGRE